MRNDEWELTRGDEAGGVQRGISKVGVGNDKSEELRSELCEELCDTKVTYAENAVGEWKKCLPYNAVKSLGET